MHFVVFLIVFIYFLIVFSCISKQYLDDVGDIQLADTLDPGGERVEEPGRQKRHRNVAAFDSVDLGVAMKGEKEVERRLVDGGVLQLQDQLEDGAQAVDLLQNDVIEECNSKCNSKEQ